MPKYPVAASGGRGSTSNKGRGNIRQIQKSIPLTEANIKAYPGNFRITEADVGFAAITTTAFYVTKKTLWAKQL
jgi:hypothetical protein